MNSSDESRPFCECDRKLATVLAELYPQHTNYNSAKCTQGTTNNFTIIGVSYRALCILPTYRLYDTKIDLGA